MKIEKIKKMSSGKYNLILENKEKIVTYDDVLIKNNVLYKNNIDSELLNKINIDTKYYNIYNKIIKLISTRMRSEKEINEYLDKNLIDNITKEEIIQKLKSNGLINDKNFVKAFINDKVNLTNFGPLKIKKDLLEHNISEQLIDEELSKIDNIIFLDKINKLINKKSKNNTKYSNYILKQKITNDLMNQGFYYEDINSCLNNLEVDNNSLIETHYEKLYKKLSLKYEDKELYKKIKEKLYQKGFSLSEIDKIINKKIG